MNKYFPLYKYFAELKEEEIALSFNDIEKILLFDLPPSAFKFRAWWGNDAYHTHARSWLDAGWVTKKVILGKNVLFLRALKVVKIPEIKFKEPQVGSIGEKNIYFSLFDIKIDFIRDPLWLEQIQNSYNYLKASFEHYLWENVLTNGWKILEGVFYYIVESNKEKSEKIINNFNIKQNIEKLDCWQLIDIVTKLNFMTFESAKAANFLKNYRNVIHPKYQKESNLKIDETSAIMFVSILKTILNGIKTNFS